jgi:hypothetical protein
VPATPQFPARLSSADIDINHVYNTGYIDSTIHVFITNYIDDSIDAFNTGYIWNFIAAHSTTYLDGSKYASEIGYIYTFNDHTTGYMQLLSLPTISAIEATLSMTITQDIYRRRSPRL